MKATLFVIENDADHALAKGLIEKLMKSDDPADRARMTAQARLIDARARPVATSGTVTTGFALLSDGAAWPLARRSRAASGNTKPGE
jgi:hypothetical protein